MSRRPDLFIIGAAKCGTTSLYHYLKGHPDVYMSPAKEPRYFAPDLVSGRVGDGMRYGRDLERYMSLFRDAQSEKRVGEASVRYINSQQAPKLISEFQPKPYIVAMIRNPVDMIHSLHNQQLLSKGVEDIADFEEALQAEEQRRMGRRVPRGSNAALLLYRDRARFGEQLSRWFETFDRERLHVIVFEDLQHDPAGTFREVLQFLEVDPDYQPPSFAVHNPSQRARSSTIMKVLDAQAPRTVARRLIAQEHRDRARRLLVRPLRRLNRKPVARTPMSRELRSRLEAEFAPDVAVLSALLGRDLAALWWQQGGLDRSRGAA